MIASARGWFEFDSKLPEIRAISFSSISPSVTTSVTEKSPVVRVPVLSKTTVLAYLIFSMNMLPFIRTPSFADSVMAETMVTGVDIRNAHGQERTRSMSVL